jgi:DNA modification methylase
MPYTLIHGSAHSLPEIADKSVHLICTSPPYYGLRSYSGDQAIDWPTVEYAPMAGLPPIRVQGCEPGCTHEWADGPRSTQRLRNGTESSNIGGGPRAGGVLLNPTQGAYCIHCGGWRGGLGLEPTIEMYIGHLILCLREWHRILRPEGTLWLNLGDSYNSSPSNMRNGVVQRDGYNQGYDAIGRQARKVAGLKPKDLMLVPARFALAAQADGWFLRSDLIWHKPNPMPESVTDRCTKAHEYIWMLAKSENYYFDQEAIREPHTDLHSVLRHKDTGRGDQAYALASGMNQRPQRNSNSGLGGSPMGRNKRSVWTISTRPYPGAHFACFPPEIPELCIRAGTSAHGVCAACLAPYRRVVERGASDWQHRKANGASGGTLTNGHNTTHGVGTNHTLGQRKITTTGWQRTCNCQSDEVIPATVCDPFNGSGTTGRAALKLGRSYIGVDISREYLEDLSPERMSNIQMELAL